MSDSSDPLSSNVKIGECSAAEDAFARFVALGRLPTQAYRMVWGATKNADAISAKVSARAHVKKRIAELRDEAYREAMMSLAERRSYLAEIARARPEEMPKHSDRIAAIREDSVLSGDRRPDGGVSVGIQVGVSLQDILGSIRSGGCATASMPAGEAGPAEAGAGDPAQPLGGDSGAVARVVGPMGVIVAVGVGNAPGGRQAASAAARCVVVE